MCPTLLGQAHERNGIFGEFGIEFDKKFDNGFDKPIWEKMPACGYSRPQEVFMRQFYLGKNSNGYYRVYFIDPVTGVRYTGKSTHTKDKIEATLIAGRWLKEGVPFARSHSRLFLSGENSSCQLNLKNIVEILSEAQADELIKLLSVKFNKSFDSALVEVPVTSEVSVSEPVPENITSVKPKKVIVVKKTITVKNTGGLTLGMRNVLRT